MSIISTADNSRVLTVAYLTAYLDTLLRAGAVPRECGPEKLRDAIDKTRKAFDLPELGSRERADA